MKGRPKTGSGPAKPTQATRDLVIERDSPDGYGVCQWCGHTITAALGYSLQHRRARASGGSTAWQTNAPANLVLLCGSATTGCHGYIEANPNDARDNGFRLTPEQDPATAPIFMYSYGLVLLDNKGNYSKGVI